MTSTTRSRMRPDRLDALQVALMRIEDGEPLQIAARLLPAAYRERKRPRQNPRALWARQRHYARR